MHQRVALLVRVLDHRAQLEHFEAAAVLPDALLRVERPAPGDRQNTERCGDDDRKRRDKERERASDVEDAFQCDPGSWDVATIGNPDSTLHYSLNERLRDGPAYGVEPVEIAENGSALRSQMKERHVFARVIGSGRGRVAAVIGGENHVVTGA